MEFGHFPPTSAIACRWTALVRPGGTFPLYLSYLEKVFSLLGMGADWRTPDVGAAQLVLSNAHPTAARFPNILSLSDFSLYIRHEPHASKFGL